MSTDEHHSGIPTRAIHESYLDMQRALKSYREAKDTLNDSAIKRAHREVQATVTTLYELLRPYLKAQDTSKDFWNGKAPPYPDHGPEPDIKDGVAILQVQRRTTNHQLNGHNDVRNMSVKELHQLLNLNSDVRITGYDTDGKTLLLAYHAYQMGLKHIDTWETEKETYTRRKGGFMANKTETITNANRIDMPRLKRAARCLSNACHDLGLLAHVEETRDSYHAGDSHEHPEPFGEAEKPE